MTNKFLFFSQLVLAAGLLAVHYVALQNALYWHYIWSDVPMHFLGGVWAALAVYWVLSLKGRTPFFSVFSGVVMIGMAWEIFEYATGTPREANYAFDTSLDLLLDTFGGILGFFAARALARGTMTSHGAFKEAQNNTP